MNYIEYMDQMVDITGVRRMDTRGQISTQHSGPQITLREFLQGLDRAYAFRESIDEAITSMEKVRDQYQPGGPAQIDMF